MEYDDRELIQTGRKFNEWEMRGTPLRIEVGENEMKERVFLLARRCDGFKEKFAIDKCEETVLSQLKEINSLMYSRAEKRLRDNTAEASNWRGFMDALNELKIVKTFWCDRVECETEVKAKSKAES